MVSEKQIMAAQQVLSRYYHFLTSDAVRAALTAAEQAEPAPAAEPVAYLNPIKPNEKLRKMWEDYQAVNAGKATHPTPSDARLSAGFVILPRSEVEAIRDKALEEAAEKARELLVFADTTSDADEHIPAAIRKLKSGGE